jgi:serine/threonine protein kinase
MSSLTTSGISTKRREFLTVAEELAVLSGQTVQIIREESEAQGVPPVQVALQKALITPAQLEIIETLCRPFEIVPGYEIRSVIGQGGMGVVFRAKQLSLKRDVAIKLVPLHQLSGNVAVKRFQVEAQVVAKLSHPNIVAAYDFGQHEGRLFFVMEFVDGEDADHHIRRHGCFEEHAAWHVVRQAVAGLAHARQAGVVHRDVKPANILLVRPPAGYPLPSGVPMAKLSDFGLAWLTTAADERTRLTSTNVAIGSPHYMAPEQLSGGAVDWRADIYSLGATAFHLLVGLPPHSGLELTRLMALKLQGKSESLRVVRPDLSAATTGLVDELMASNPNDRPQDYGVLIDRIDQLIGKDITGSRRITASGRMLASTQISDPEPGLTSTQLEAVDPQAVTQAIPDSEPHALTRKIPDAVLTPPKPRRMGFLATITLGLVIVALGATAFHFWNLPGQPDMVVVGSTIGLPFKDVQDLQEWKYSAGSRRNVVPNNEKAQVLEVNGTVTRRFADRMGKNDGWANYCLEMVVDLHKAKAVEVHVDFAGKGLDGKPPPRDDHRLVLRVTKEGSQLGMKSGDHQGWVRRGPLVPLKPLSHGKHELRLERHTAGWWVFVDKDVVGFSFSRVARDANEFRLITDDGAAWFSDFDISEMQPKVAQPVVPAKK